MGRGHDGRPATQSSRASSRSRFSLESSPSALFRHPDEREPVHYLTSYVNDYNTKNGGKKSVRLDLPVAGQKIMDPTKFDNVPVPAVHWDEKTESWQPGKPKKFDIYNQYFESQIDMSTPDLQKGDAFHRSSKDYGKTTLPGAGVLGEWHRGRPANYNHAEKQAAYADLPSSSHVSRKRDKKSIEMLKFRPDYNAVRKPPPTAPTTVPSQGTSSGPVKWSGVKMDKLMLAPGDVNNRCRWNRNASVVGDTMMMPEEHMVEYITESNHAARRTLKSSSSVSTASRAHGYGEKEKKRDDTMVSADCPTWMQLPHVGVKELSKDQIQSLEQWNVPLPQYYLPVDSRAQSVASFGSRSRASSVASGYNASSRGSRHSRQRAPVLGGSQVWQREGGAHGSRLDASKNLPGLPVR